MILYIMVPPKIEYNIAIKSHMVVTWGEKLMI